MKSTVLSLVFLGASVAASHCATLTFTNVGTGALATGFADSAGSITSGLIWGVVVDSGNNGFASSLWTGGFNYNAAVGGIVLSTTGGVTDDVLFLHTAATTSRTGDGATASSAVNSISTVTFTNGVTGNKPFGIIWFDRGIALGSAATAGQKYGFITQGLSNSVPFALPAGEADATDYSPDFAGTDPNKSATLSLAGTVVPEPSAVLLGAVGALGILRRRRN